MQVMDGSLEIEVLYVTSFTDDPELHTSSNLVVIESEAFFTCSNALKNSSFQLLASVSDFSTFNSNC